MILTCGQGGVRCWNTFEAPWRKLGPAGRRRARQALALLEEARVNHAG